MGSESRNRVSGRGIDSGSLRRGRCGRVAGLHRGTEGARYVRHCDQRPVDPGCRHLFHAGGQAGKERPLPHPQNPDRATREDADVRCRRVSFGTTPPGAEPSQGNGQRQPSGIDCSSHRRCTVHSDHQPSAGQNRERRSRGDLRCSNGSGPCSSYLQPHPRPHHSGAGCSIYPRWQLFGYQHKHPEPRCIPAAGQRSSADRHLGVFC